MNTPHVISGLRLRYLIENAHALLRHKYRKKPLWALVCDITGHGSTVSIEICIEVGLDPHQNCGGKVLKGIRIR